MLAGDQDLLYKQKVLSKKPGKRHGDTAKAVAVVVVVSYTWINCGKVILILLETGVSNDSTICSKCYKMPENDILPPLVLFQYIV